MERIVFKQANLFDGEHPTRPGVTVVVEGERIAAVSNGDGPAPNPGDRVIDLAGKTLMPGMYTCHFHTAYHNLGSSPAPLGLDHPPTYLALLAANNVRTLLMCGYTGAVGASAGRDIDATIKAAISDGVIQGPRLMAASRDIVSTGDSAVSTGDAAASTGDAAASGSLCSRGTVPLHSTTAITYPLSLYNTAGI